MTAADDSGRPAGAGFVGRVASMAARLTYRDIQVVAVGTPPTGPVLLVSNHFGGLAGALLLLHLSARFPRIVARDVIWRYPGAGQVMRWIGAIPVHRRADATGIHYEDKAAFRSRVLVAFSDPLDVDGFVADLAADQQAPNPATQVRALTNHVEDGLREVAPGYRDWTEADELHLAAEALVRSTPPGPLRPRDVPLAASAPVASALSRLADSEVAPVREAAASYRAALAPRRLTDAIVGSGAEGRSPPLLRSVLDTLLVALFLPYAALGAALAALPYLVTQATRLIPVAPAAWQIPGVLWWLAIPALAVWAVTVVDITSARHLTPARRVAWVAAVTIAFPVALVWHLTRPVGAPDPVRLDEPSDGDDPWGRPARLVVARTRGMLTQEEYQSRLSTLAAEADPAGAQEGDVDARH